MTDSLKGPIANSGSTLELINATILDVINGEYFDAATRLFIKDGKLEIVGGRADAPGPDAKIDLKGKTVIPGLFNVHCHIQMINPTVFSNFKTIKARKKFHDRQVEKSMADCLERGITNIRDAFTNDLEINRDLSARIQKNEIPGPRIQQSVVVGALGGYLTPEVKGFRKILLGVMGLSAIDYEKENSGVVTFPVGASEQQARDAVDRAIDQRGADVIKVGESLELSPINPNPNIMTPGQLEAITDQARRRGVQSTIHSVSVDTFNRAVKAGFSSLAHMARDAGLTEADIEALVNSDCIIEPTLSVAFDMSWKLEGNPYAADPNMEKLYEFRNRTFTDIANEFWEPALGEQVIAGFNKAGLGKYKMLGMINLSNMLEHFARMAHFGVQNSKALLERGATVACGNDGGVQACTPAMVTHELAMLDLFMNDESGKKFDETAAIKTATINSAKSMGIDNQFGSIETGKTADLVVIDGDPLKDFRLIGSKAAAVFKDGNLVVNVCGLKEMA